MAYARQSPDRQTKVAARVSMLPVRWLKTAMDVLLPDTCVLCRQAVAHRQPHLLCPFCWAALPRNVNGCGHCGLPQASPGVCGACTLRPLTSTVCVAALRHEEDAKALVHRLKYQHDLRAGNTLAQVMRQMIEARYRNAALPEALVPVPLSYRRQVRRGYNQAAWLALQLHHALGLPVQHRLVRRRSGPPQQTLTRRQRLQLSAGTFMVRKPPIRQTHVAIVDDVLTTGATTRALRAQLLAAGAERVDIWCATRAVLH